MHPLSQEKVNISPDEKWEREHVGYLFAFWCCDEVSLWKCGRGGVGDSNTCSKMPFLPQKLAV